MKRMLSGHTGGRRAAGRAGVATAATLGCLALVAGPAHAAGGAGAGGAAGETAARGGAGAGAAAEVRLDYPLSGTTHLSGPGSDLTLGPGSLKTSTDMTTGALTAETQLPDAPGSFTALGIPITVTTEFVEDQPTTGTLDVDSGSVRTTSHLTLRLKDLKVAGIPTPVGSRCQTKTPAVIDLTSEDGFSVFGGGKLSGEYTIPKFEHCLLATPVINSMVPGDGNTLTLTLGPAAPPAP